MAALAELAPGILVEDKGYSLALHYRLAPDQGPRLSAAVAAICAETAPHSVNVLPGKFVFEVKPADPLTFFCVTVMLSAVAFMASYLPARQAAKVDPMVALRNE